MQSYKNAINDYIDSKKDEMTAFLRELVKIPSFQGEPLPNMPFGENVVKVLNLTLNHCKKLGLNIKNIDNYVGSADYCPDESFPKLGILCHLDVVPEGSGWSVPPFDITETSGKLIGRGAIDDKGPAVAVLYAVLAVKELLIPLENGVRLIFGTNEENGSCDLLYYRKKEPLPPLLFTPDGSYPIINSEKGMLRIGLSSNINKTIGNKNVVIHSIKGGNAINAVPEQALATVSGISIEEIRSYVNELNIDINFKLSEKYNLILIEAIGKSAHASLPHNGKNAVTALILLLSKISEYTIINELAKLYPFDKSNGQSLGIDYTNEFTSVLSVIDFDGKILEAKADIRYPKGKTSEEIIATLLNAFNKANINLSILFRNEPHYVDENNEFIKDLLEVYTDITGNDGYCVAIGGGTYVHGIENSVAFGAEFPGDENNMHGADEFITIDSLLLNAKIYANAIVKICGKKD